MDLYYLLVLSIFFFFFLIRLKLEVFKFFKVLGKLFKIIFRETCVLLF